MATLTVRVELWPVKDPEEKLIYGHTYGEASADDPIQTSEWSVPAGILSDSEAITLPDEVVIRLWGGTLGQEYEIKNTVTLASGAIIVRRAVLRVAYR